MISNEQKERAKSFYAMHQSEKMFVLPNVWNVGSAYVFEKQGFKAVATSSAGIAYDLGYPDGEDISFENLLEVVKRITARISIPLSVDFERGYGESVQEVKENAKRLILAGAIGCNIEDGLPNGDLLPVDLQVEKIQALVELKRDLGIDFVINARTCAYWLNVGDDDEKMTVASARGNAYAKAGADCIFIPGAIDELVIAKLKANIPAPINIILNGECNDFDKLEEIGVRRLSVGSAPVRYIYNEAIKMASDLANNEVKPLIDNAFTYGKANEYFESF